VTIGNILGGAVFVGLAYWFIYLRGGKKTDMQTGPGWD
jgi:formate transporter